MYQKQKKRQRLLNVHFKMLKIVKRGKFWRIRNSDSKKTYVTKYRSKAAARRKVKVINDWFKSRRSN